MVISVLYFIPVQIRKYTFYTIHNGMLYAPDSLTVTNNITTELLHQFKEVYSHETNTRKFKHNLIHEHVIADSQLNRAIK